MKLIQATDQGHSEQDTARKFPPPPAESSPQKPCQKKPSDGEIQKVGQLVCSRKRGQLHIVTGERREDPQPKQPQPE